MLRLKPSTALELADDLATVAYAGEHAAEEGLCTYGPSTGICLGAFGGIQKLPSALKIGAGVPLDVLRRYCEAQNISVSPLYAASQNYIHSLFWGGLSMTQRRSGLLCDSLVAVDIVSPTYGAEELNIRDGDPRKCEMLWALKGIGPSVLGVVTSITLVAQPALDLTRIVMQWKAIGYFASVISWWLRTLPYTDSRLTPLLLLGGISLESDGLFVGSREEAEDYVASLRLPHPCRVDLSDWDAYKDSCAYTPRVEYPTVSTFVGSGDLPAATLSMLQTAACRGEIVVDWLSLGGCVAATRDGAFPYRRRGWIMRLHTTEKSSPLIGALRDLLGIDSYREQATCVSTDWRAYAGRAPQPQRLQDIKRSADPLNTLRYVDSVPPSLGPAPFPSVSCVLTRAA